MSLKGICFDVLLAVCPIYQFVWCTRVSHQLLRNYLNSVLKLCYMVPIGGAVQQKWIYWITCKVLFSNLNLWIGEIFYSFCFNLFNSSWRQTFSLHFSQYLTRESRPNIKFSWWSYQFKKRYHNELLWNYQCKICPPDECCTDRMLYICFLHCIKMYSCKHTIQLFVHVLSFLILYSLYYFPFHTSCFIVQQNLKKRK